MKKFRDILHNEKAAIDLASIMVGIVVIGIIGGVISATVFAVIPWAHDEAAKSSLKSVQLAQNVYAGLSADPTTSSLSLLAAGATVKTASNVPLKYASSIDELEETKLLSNVDRSKLTVATGVTAQCYVAMARSDSGKLFWASDSSAPAEYRPGVSTSDCVSLPDVAEGLDPDTEPSTIESPGELAIRWQGDSTYPVSCEISGGYCVNGTEPEWAAGLGNVSLTGVPQSWAEGVQNGTFSAQLRTTGKYATAQWSIFLEADGTTLTNAEVAAAYPGATDEEIRGYVIARVNSGELTGQTRITTTDDPLSIVSDTWTLNSNGTALSMRPPITVIEKRVQTAIAEETSGNYIQAHTTSGSVFVTVPAEVEVVNNSTGERRTFPVEIILDWDS